MGTAGRLMIAMALAGGVADAAPKIWTTTSDFESWTDVSDALRAQVEPTLDTTEVPGAMEIVRYQQDETRSVDIVIFRLPPDGRRDTLANFEQGQRDQWKKAHGEEVVFEHELGPKTSVTDQINQLDGVGGPVRRLTGFLPDGHLVSVTATCQSPATTPCGHILRTISLDESQLAPLAKFTNVPQRAQETAPESSVDKKSDAYTAGRIAGIALLVLFVGFWFWRNR